MEHAVYLQGIKKALKARGTTYAELGAHLKMTESGVKKMLNAKDISFRRVLQICEALQVLPGQLFSLSEKTSIPVLHLTDKQQEALMKERSLLAVYWRLTIEKKEVEDIGRLQKMSPAELKKVLQRLVSLDLIDHKRNRYLAKHTGKFRWPDDTKLARMLNQEWSLLTLKRALQIQDREQRAHRFVALRLSEKSSRALRAQMAQVLDEAVQISEREELTISRRELQDWTVLVALARGGVLDAT